MHGRSCVGLLAWLLLIAASWTQSQSVQHPDAPVTPSSDSLASEQHQIVAHDPISGVRPSLPLPPTRIPWPLPRPLPIVSIPPGFARLAHAAGIIFSGTVTKIERSSTDIPGQAVGTVVITFHVENAIRGARSGGTLKISQWIGLWSSGQRYRVGERTLLFLYPRSKVGLTSCVGIAMGRFAVDSSGNVWPSPQQVLAFRTDPVLGGKSQWRISDFASAVRWADEEE